MKGIKRFSLEGGGRGILSREGWGLVNDGRGWVNKMTTFEAEMTNSISTCLIQNRAKKQNIFQISFKDPPFHFWQMSCSTHCSALALAQVDADDHFWCECSI